jgi:hypothetical protein
VTITFHVLPWIRRTTSRAPWRSYSEYKAKTITKNKNNNNTLLKKRNILSIFSKK